MSRAARRRMRNGRIFPRRGFSPSTALVHNNSRTEWVHTGLNDAQPNDLLDYRNASCKHCHGLGYAGARVLDRETILPLVCACCWKGLAKFHGDRLESQPHARISSTIWKPEGGPSTL